MAKHIKIVAEKILEHGDEWLVIKGADVKKIGKKFERFGFEKEGKTWRKEAPVKEKKLNRLKDKLEKIGFLLHVKEVKTPVKPMEGTKAKEGRSLLKAYLTDRELAERARADAKESGDALAAFAKKYGVNTKPGTEDAIVIIDSTKVQWQYTKGRDKFDEEVALKWANKKSIRKQFPTLVVQVDTIDDETWGGLKKSGDIPEDILEAAEKRGDDFYKLAMYDLSESVCTKCGEKIKKKDKFCSGCGHKL